MATNRDNAARAAEEVQKRALEIQAGADALLTSGGGGIAVWVRRDELEPRCAIRLSTKNPAGEEVDAVTLAAIFAALRVGSERAIDAMADQVGMPRETLRGMVGVAYDLIAPKYTAGSRVIHRPDKPNG